MKSFPFVLAQLRDPPPSLAITRSRRSKMFRAISPRASDFRTLTSPCTRLFKSNVLSVTRRNASLSLKISLLLLVSLLQHSSVLSLSSSSPLPPSLSLDVSGRVRRRAVPQSCVDGVFPIAHFEEAPAVAQRRAWHHSCPMWMWEPNTRQQEQVRQERHLSARPRARAPRTLPSEWAGRTPPH